MSIITLLQILLQNILMADATILGWNRGLNAAFM